MKQCKILAQVNHFQILLSCSWNAVKTSIEEQLKFFNRAQYILVLCSEVYIMEWNSRIIAGLPVAIGFSLEFPQLTQVKCVRQISMSGDQHICT